MQTESTQSEKRNVPFPRMKLWAAILVVAVVGIVISGVFTSTQRIELPAVLGSLTLTDQLAGEAAARMIDHLHGKGVTPSENLIGFYSGAGGTATLYVSRFESKREATQVMERMAQRIRQGNPVFGNFKDRTIVGKRVAECYGLNQVHYFFSHDVRLYWLGVDPPRAEETLEELLRIAVN